MKWLQGSPAHILGVGSVGHAPVIDVKTLAELRRTWLLVTHTALTLTRVKVLQDSTERKFTLLINISILDVDKFIRPGCLKDGWGETTLTHATVTHIAVMASFWKVTKAMPRGLVLTFSFSFRYSSLSFASSFV